jgi:hypothetical protein
MGNRKMVDIVAQHCLLAWVGVSEGNRQCRLAFLGWTESALGSWDFDLQRAFYASICYAADETR